MNAERDRDRVATMDERVEKSLVAGLDHRDLLWVLAGSLLASVFALVAYDQLFGLHFAAWQLYETTPSTEPLAEALRGPVTGWYRFVTVALTTVAGAISAARAVRGHWRPLAALVGLTLVAIVGVEVTQSAGQRRTPTSEVDSVAIISVIWLAMLGLLPLVVAIVAILRARRQEPEPVPVSRSSRFG